jgi:hypothetical protein
VLTLGFYALLDVPMLLILGWFVLARGCPLM